MEFTAYVLVHTEDAKENKLRFRKFSGCAAFASRVYYNKAQAEEALNRIEKVWNVHDLKVVAVKGEVSV